MYIYNFNKLLLDVTSIATSSTPTPFSSVTTTQTLSQSSDQETTEFLHTTEQTPTEGGTEAEQKNE